LAPFPGTTLCENVNDYDLQILTRDWSRYDANDAIVQTGGLTAQDIRDFVAIYDKEMNGDWQDVMDRYKTGKNSPYDDLRVEGHFRMNISFAILKNDLVEKLGFIDNLSLKEGGGSAQKILIERMKKEISGHPDLIENTINDFISRGYLNEVQNDHGVTWRWT
jgi:hypothetical protein